MAGARAGHSARAAVRAPARLTSQRHSACPAPQRPPPCGGARGPASPAPAPPRRQAEGRRIGAGARRGEAQGRQQR
eukprot:549699-Alexandrium_andersonii.AAC.1